MSAGAFRPGDILRSRKGLTVEIENTDAEGRLVLADALAFADEAEPELIVSMATLTGAARVALGPDIVPFYTRSDSLATCLENASVSVRDPIWRMPLWPPYEKMIEPEDADLVNANALGGAGSVTAAMFLARFVTKDRRFSAFRFVRMAGRARPRVVLKAALARPPGQYLRRFPKFCRCE